MTGSRHDRQFWERAVREVERCGSVGDVARRLGVQARTLTWWRWRIRREGAEGEAKLAKRAEFIPVVMAAGAAHAEAPLMSGLFVDHAVLQRDRPVNVFGHAAAGEIMGCKEATVSWHIHAAKKTLRGLL